MNELDNIYMYIYIYTYVTKVSTISRWLKKIQSVGRITDEPKEIGVL